MAAQGATTHVTGLGDDDELRARLEQMREEAKETEKRCTEVAGFNGKKTAILDAARETRDEGAQMMETYLRILTDPRPRRSCEVRSDGTPAWPTEEEHGQRDDREHEQDRMDDRASSDRDDQQHNPHDQPQHLNLLSRGEDCRISVLEPTPDRSALRA
jgi:hypothetical protein